jgi:hypothetical protein
VPIVEIGIIARLEADASQPESLETIAELRAHYRRRDVRVARDALGGSQLAPQCRVALQRRHDSAE